MCKRIDFVDDHMVNRDHFSDIHRYISNEINDGDKAAQITSAVKALELPWLLKTLLDESFQKSCTPRPPSEVYGEEWRKLANVRFQVNGKSLYFQVVFSKIGNCLKIVTAFPNRKPKKDISYYCVPC